MPKFDESPSLYVGALVCKQYTQSPTGSDRFFP